jgi:DNA polymerase-1
MCIWKLNLPVPQILWDTWVAEKAFCLGLHHARYENAAAETEFDLMIAAEEAEDKILSKLNLTATCLRRGVHYPLAGDKERLQRSFLDHPREQSFSDEQIEYASADAVAAAQLYSVQVQVAVQQDCLRHLETVEMPWAVTNSQIVWNGVFVDPAQLVKLNKACAKHIGPKQAELADMGLENIRSPKQVKDFFQSRGLLDYFRRGKGHSFDDKNLKAAKDLHPAVKKIRTLRKIVRLSGDKLLTGELIGADGRLHPDHRQLGSETGRNAMRWPNVGGLGRALRPLVVPEAGFAIGEVDLSQIEVGISAAVFNDPDLIRMFNGQDVYVAMAKRFYADKLTPAEISLPDQKFKKQCSKYRDKMKVYTLAIIYGVTAIGLAAQLGINKIQAEKERERFLQMFSQLNRALQEAAAYGAIRGYAYLCSGLRRHRGRSGRPSNWERNWLKNTPVQGSAGVVFKVAGNRLRLRYEHYGSKIVLPMHDAFVFECPKQHLQTVAEITAEVMRSAVQEYFPVLDPRVDVNIDHPDCWNKDGKYLSLKRWMIDPEQALR